MLWRSSPLSIACVFRSLKTPRLLISHKTRDDYVLTCKVPNWQSKTANRQTLPPSTNQCSEFRAGHERHFAKEIEDVIWQNIIIRSEFTSNLFSQTDDEHHAGQEPYS